MFTIFNQHAVSENERAAYFNQKYSRFWKFDQISAIYHFKVAASLHEKKDRFGSFAAIFGF